MLCTGVAYACQCCITNGQSLAVRHRARAPSLPFKSSLIGSVRSNNNSLLACGNYSSHKGGAPLVRQAQPIATPILTTACPGMLFFISFFFVSIVAPNHSNSCLLSIVFFSCFILIRCTACIHTRMHQQHRHRHRTHSKIINKQQRNKNKIQGKKNGEC